MTVRRTVSVWSIGAGLAAQAVNQLDRWIRLDQGSYQPYGASFVKAHLLAYAGVAATAIGLAIYGIVSAPPIRRWAFVGLLGAVLQAIGLAADIPSHLVGGDSEAAHLLGYAGLAIELAGLAQLTARLRDGIHHAEP